MKILIYSWIIYLTCFLGSVKAQLTANGQVKMDSNYINYYPFMDKLPKDYKYYISDYCDRYIATYNFNQAVLFSL